MLLRPESEPLAKTLGRLSATLSKKPKSKKPAERPAVAALEIRLCAADDIPIDAEATSLLKAMTEAATLRLGPEMTLPVLFEPPEVQSLLLPTVPLVGVPMRACASTRNCDPHECSWLWERAAAAATGEWTCVGRRAEYTPSAGDVGSMLRVRAEPPPPAAAAAAAATASLGSDAAASLGFTVEAVGEVEVAPERRLLVPRVRAMHDIRQLVGEMRAAATGTGAVDSGELSAAGLAAAVDLTAAATAAATAPPADTICPDDSSFRILSYNLMADSCSFQPGSNRCLAKGFGLERALAHLLLLAAATDGQRFDLGFPPDSRHWDGAGSVHSYCAPSLTRAALRMPRLLAEVQAFSPDIVCLQECDRTWCEQMWQPALEDAGYSCHFALKRSAGSSEGVATFVRTSRFQVVDSKTVPLDLADGGAPPSLQLLLDSQPLTREGMRGLPTVGQLLMLQQVVGGAVDGAVDGAEAVGGAEVPRRRLLVANTHLYFANPAVHVRLMQTAALLHAAHTWNVPCEFGREPTPHFPPPPPAALLLAGDLNSDSTDAVLRLLTRGYVSADDHDWVYGALLWSPSVGLEEDARRAAHEAAARHSDAIADESSRRGDGGGGGSGGGAAAADGMAMTLEGLRHLALRFHRLRKAIPNLRAAAPATTSLDAPGAASADTEQALEQAYRREVVAEVANGRTLLDSEALAAAELVSELSTAQAPLTLTLARSAGGVQAARTRLVELGAQLEEGLEEGSKALRASVGGDASAVDVSAAEAGVASSAEADVASTRQQQLAQLGCAVLHQPTRLKSAYGLHTHPTHVVPRYANALDWICLDAEQLEVRAVAPLPSLEELTRDVAIPSAEFPSDHVALCCDLSWR